MNMLFRPLISLLTLSILLTVFCQLSAADARGLQRKSEIVRAPAATLTCAGIYKKTSQSPRDPDLVNILPTYARLLPFDGTVQFQSPDGRHVIEHNIMGRRTYFYTEKGDGPWVQKNYDMMNRVINDLIPIVSVNPKYVPADYVPRPLDIENLFEKAVSDVYGWSPEQRIQEKNKFLIDEQGEQSIRFLDEHPEATAALNEFFRPIFNRIENVNDVTFVELKVAFPKSKSNSFEADINRVFLDLYFTCLQRAYRNHGDARLIKALKLIDSWVQSHQANDEVKVHLAFDTKLWNLLLKQIHTLYVNDAELKTASSHNRARILGNHIKRFLPLAGMTLTRINGQTLEAGRRFNNEDTDPLAIVYKDGKSPIREKALKNTVTQFYKWTLQDIPEDSNIWARAFSLDRFGLLSKLGFKEPEKPSAFYTQNKKQIESYWQIEKSWLMEQTRQDWLRKLEARMKD